MEPNGGKNDQKKERVPRMPNRPYAYFRDDQLTCLMTHNQETLTNADLEPWRDQLHGFFKEQFSNEQFPEGPRIVWPPRCISFGTLQGNENLPAELGGEAFKKPFSVLACDMENVPQDPSDFLDFISLLSERNPDPNPEASPLPKSLVKRKFAGITIEGVSPNWLTSGASQAGGTGGPGGWPVPYRGNASRAPYQFRDLISKLNDLEVYGDGDGVDVVILDTAPSPHDLVAAYKEYKNWHPLIRTLLGPNGKLKLYPASYDENLRMGSTSLNEHDYKMTDHGLFAAGIVHSIAPNATIHLIEVLNPFGVGDLEILSRGFRRAYDEIYKVNRAEGKNRPMVVNCSWMLEPPIAPDHRRDPDSQFEQKVMDMAMKYQDEKEAFALKHICDEYSKMGRQVIAAAGNDGRGDGKDRTRAPVTRYPAAFLSTFGVGALPKDSKEDQNGNYAGSSYSNLADIPDIVTKIMTLGGEEGEEKGVLGLYLGEFPDCGCETQANCTKWAWWAGTSFATPILTGTIASVLSNVGAQKTNKEVIDLITEPAGPQRPSQPSQPGQKEKVIKRHRTNADEDVMVVSQTY